MLINQNHEMSKQLKKESNKVNNYEKEEDSFDSNYR